MAALTVTNNIRTLQCFACISNSHMLLLYVGRLGPPRTDGV